jgi:anti-sigma regulatory factor (Ser/Thr protein kinase)
MSPVQSSSCTAVLELEMPCELSQVRAVALKLHAFLEQHHCTPREIRDCELAFVEACNNAVLYVAPTSRALPVSIQATCAPDLLEIRIRDHTASFDWPESAALPEAASERGRGLYIIQALVDHAQYVPAADGNTLVLRKRRAVRC